jgi:hypothetical protein
LWNRVRSYPELWRDPYSDQDPKKSFRIRIWAAPWPVFKFFRCLNDLITQKVYFLRLIRVCLGLIMLAMRRYLFKVSLLFIGQHGLGHFFRYRPFVPIGWRIVQILRQRRRKTTSAAPTTLGAIQAASESSFINARLYSTCD